MKRWDPEIHEGIPLCRNCGQSWSNHTMSGYCTEQDPPEDGSDAHLTDSEWWGVFGKDRS